MRRLRRRGDERGAALVEAALVTPILFLVIFAIIEGGLFFKDFLTIANGTRVGARTAVELEADGFADWHIIQEVNRALAALGNGDLQYVVVYHANNEESDPDPRCRAGTPVLHSSDPANACNVYRPADLAVDYDTFRSGAYMARLSWPGDVRDVTQAGGTDFVGVYVRSRFTSVTGVLGGDRVLEDSTVMRLEAKLT